MSQAELMFRVTADASAAREQIRQLAERVRGLLPAGEAARQGMRGVAAATGDSADAISRASTAVGPLAGGIEQVGRTSSAAAAYTANLGYQVNDIAVMLSAGQNPFMLMMQQGPQVVQVFQQMRASGLSLAGGLRAALSSMVSPMALLTMAAIGGGAALVQWAMSGVEATVSLEDAMSNLKDGVSAYESSAAAAARRTAELRKEFGEGAGAARALLTEIAALDRWRAAGALAGSSAALEDQYDLRVQGRISAVQLSDMFGLSMFGQGREARKAQIGSVIEGFDDVQAAAGLADEDARIDAMAAATSRLREAFAAAADVSGGRSETEREILRTLTEQELAAHRLKAIRDDEMRAHREWLREMQQGEDRATRATRPDAAPAITGEATKASWDARADLDRQAAMAALIAEHGRDSLEVARAQVEEERRLYEVQLQKEAISEPERQRRLEAWDLAKGMPALESQRRVEAERLLATLQQEEVLQRAIATYGEDSAEVARLRADQERAAFEATLATLGVSDELRGKLMEAWENARGLGATDMAGGIAAAREEARAMADEIMRALGAAQALSAQGVSGLRESELRVKYAKDPVRLAGELARNRMITAQGVRREGAEGLELASLDAEVEAYARNMMQIERNNIAQRAAIGKGSKGGGAGGRNTLAGLSKEAMEILSGLDVAAAAIGEKVKVGLISVADGENQMAQAKSRAASQLADLIARLDSLGPAGKAAADAARAALKDLAAEAGKTDTKIRDGMIRSFEDNFVRSLSSGKDAMTSFADHVQSELARAFTQKFITPMISPLIDSVMGIFGGAFAAGGVPDAPGLAEHRNTVVNRPTPFAMRGGRVGVMGEAGPEAIMPVITGAAGQGVRATAPDGSETVLPLQRASDGKLGVAVPPAQPAPDQRPQSGRAILLSLLGQRLPDADHRNTVVDRSTPFAMRGGRVGVMGEAGPEAILPLRRGRGGAGVLAVGPGGAQGVLPLRRDRGGALAVQVPDLRKIIERPVMFAAGGIVGADLPEAVAERTGSGAQSPRGALNVNIVNAHPGAKVEAKERQDGGGFAVEVVIEQLESALADRARRGVGSLSGVLGDTFGLGRVGR